MHDLDLAHKELALADTVLKMNEMLSQSVAVHNHNEILGIVHRNEILNGIGTRADDSAKLKDFLSEKLYSIEANEDLSVAKQLMEKHCVDKLIVTKNSNAIGILTQNELDKHFQYELGKRYTSFRR